MCTEALLVATLLLAQQERPIPALLEKLRSEKIEDREEAERELSRRGEAVKSAVQGLLSSEDAELRLRARRILESWLPALTPDEEKEIDGLLAQTRVAPLEGGDPERDNFFFVDEKIWKRWATLGTKPTRYLLKLHRESSGLRRGQLLSLAARSGDRAALPAALEGLRSPEPAVRLYAVSACGSIGDSAAVPILVRLLRDQASVHPPGSGFPDTVALRAAWAIESLVGFPVDPDLWVEFKFPVDRAHHGMALRAERIEAWWERNRQWRTREEWRKAAEEEAIRLAASDHPSQERLSGCLLLLVFGGHDREVCRAIFEIYRDAPVDGEESWRRRRCLGFLVKESSPWLPFKGRPAQRIESFVLEELQKEPGQKDRTALLGLCWELCSDRSDWLPGFGKAFSLTALRPQLRRALTSKDPVDRTLAALTLGFFGEDAAEPALIDALREARPDGVGAPWVAPANRWTDRGPQGLALMLLEALQGLRSSAARDAIRLHAEHPDVRVKVAAWGALAQLGDRGILPSIREFLDKREGDPINLDGLWRDAVNCLYVLDREEALRWCRKEFQGKRELKFFHWLVATSLAKHQEPLAVELWIASPFTTWSGCWQDIPSIRPEVLIPALLDLMEQGAPQARRGLALLVPRDAVEGRSVKELRSWWQANAATFKLTRENLQDIEGRPEGR
jgi:hypothetical protein